LDFFLFFLRFIPCFKAKKKTKLENKDKPKQIPKTIENCRVKDETFVNDIENDDELKLDLRTDELSKHLIRILPDPTVVDDDDDFKRNSDDLEEKNFNEANSLEADEAETADQPQLEDEQQQVKPHAIGDEPKILITTTEIKISFKTYKLCRELSRILPNAQYFYRKNVRLSKVIPEAIKRAYSAIIVINENRKEPSGSFDLSLDLSDSFFLDQSFNTLFHCHIDTFLQK
jgi:hypothetical protein